jgi:hypothetical protein
MRTDKQLLVMLLDVLKNESSPNCHNGLCFIICDIEDTDEDEQARLRAIIENNDPGTRYATEFGGHVTGWFWDPRDFAVRINFVKQLIEKYT